MSAWRTDSAKLLKLCMHELGHYLVGRELGTVPSDVTVAFSGPTRYQGGSAASIRRNLTTVDEIRGYLEERVCILMAGTLGEHLSVHATTGAVLDRDRWMREAVTAYEHQPSSSSDRNKGEELVRTLLFIEGAGGDDEARLDERMRAVSNRIWEKAIDILGSKAGPFLEVARQMAARVRFMGVKETFAPDELEAWFTAAERHPRALP